MFTEEGIIRKFCFHVMLVLYYGNLERTRGISLLEVYQVRSKHV